MKVQGLMILVAIFYLAYADVVKGQPREDCPKSCGDVTIEYPFGISSGCYYAEDPSFNLTCNDEKKLFTRGALEVVSISRSSQLRVLAPRSYACYNNTGNFTTGKNSMIYLGNLSLSTNNVFTGVGCNRDAYLKGYGLGLQNQIIGCVVDCGSSPGNGSCPGEGCCQIPVSKMSGFLYVEIRRYYNASSDTVFSPCTYAFLAENGTFDFSASKDLLGNVKKFAVLLDWSIGNKTCDQVNEKLCRGNSECFDSSRGEGYNCKCKDGYEGNPYLLDGCKDINECTDYRFEHMHKCGNVKFCENTGGKYKCNCPFGYWLDSKDGCTFGWTPVLLGTTIGFLVLLLGALCIKQRLRHRKETELRQQFFEQNGGGMLRQRLSGPGSSNVDIQIFTEAGMKTATNGYDKSRILGEGGQGTVYKGILSDNSTVAIKKARLGDSSQVEQFINEVLVLSQINHRNVVKLLGCCLETEVPLLVYEFVTNGTLFDHLHGSMLDSTLTWEHRLRIAIEVAGTLAYLHSSASIPIIHRDVKTANILLDENLTAKVADFGASRLIPMDKEQLTTMVQGTIGYLDPEYYNTGLLNEKSDVYSFGVVLMELLTGQKAMCFERPQYSKHLVSYFASATKENRLDEVIDSQVMNPDSHREIHEVAKVAVWCTRLMGEERPRMKEVAAELEGLRVKPNKHGKMDQYPEPEETEHLLSGHSLSTQGDTNGSGYDSIMHVSKLDIETGR